MAPLDHMNAVHETACGKPCALHLSKDASNRRTDDGYKCFLALTRREQQAFFLVLEGLSVKQMGAEMSVSRKTAENHRSRMMERLGLHNAVEAVRFAVRYGILHAGNV